MSCAVGKGRPLMELGENILEKDILWWNISASWTAGITYFLPRVPLQDIFSGSDAVQPTKIFHQRVPFTEYFRPVWWCSAGGNLPPEGTFSRTFPPVNLYLRNQVFLINEYLVKLYSNYEFCRLQRGVYYVCSAKGTFTLYFPQVWCCSAGGNLWFVQSNIKSIF